MTGLLDLMKMCNEQGKSVLCGAPRLDGTSFSEPSLPALILRDQQRASKLLQWESISLLAGGGGIVQAKKPQKYPFHLRLATQGKNKWCRGGVGGLQAPVK